MPLYNEADKIQYQLFLNPYPKNIILVVVRTRKYGNWDEIQCYIFQIHAIYRCNDF